MMGVGTDIVAIGRVADVLEAHGRRFLERVLTPVELVQKQWDAPELARRWALKEAVAKALGTGIGSAVGFQDIEITYDDGRPVGHVKGYEDRIFHVSVSDDAKVGAAVAFCMIWRSL